MIVNLLITDDWWLTSNALIFEVVPGATVFEEGQRLSAAILAAQAAHLLRFIVLGRPSQETHLITRHL